MLDSLNVKALYRRARARSLPINSGVEDFKLAMVDLKRLIEIDPTHKPSLKEINRLSGLINVNRKREKDTYGKMFTSSASVSEYVEQKIKREPLNFRSAEDEEYERENLKMNAKV